MIDQDKAERAFMGALLADPAKGMVYAKSHGVCKDYFTDERWQGVWLAIDKIWTDGKISGADVVSIWEAAKKLAADEGLRVATVYDMESVIDAKSMSDVTIHVDDLRDAWVFRRYRAAQARVAKDLDKLPALTAVTAMRRELGVILGDSVSDKRVAIGDVLDTCYAEARLAYEKRVDPAGPRDLNWTPGYKMPWPELTSNIGGLEPGLHIIAARPSVGKTSYAINLMRFWTDMGYKVLFNSLDMDKKALMWRFIAERARVSILKSRFTPTKVNLDAIAAANKKCATMPLDFCQIKEISDFRTFCAIEKEAGRAEIIVVDYLGLMNAKCIRTGNEYETVSYVSNELKAMALELGVPVVCLCQLNREVTKNDVGRMPTIADLRGSGAIEQDAYTVTLLHRDDIVKNSWKENPPVQLMRHPQGWRPGMSLHGIDALDAVWVDVCKAQNYKTSALPFVVRKNYFVWSLADIDADPIQKEVGFGAAKRTVDDNTPLFARVHADWRNDPIEGALVANGALIKGAIYAVTTDEDDPEEEQELLWMEEE